jgi:hypothetical protein
MDNISYLADFRYLTTTGGEMKPVTFCLLTKLSFPINIRNIQIILNML